MISLAWIFTIVALIPFGLYLLGRIRDPFHPLIFMGSVSFSVVGLFCLRYHNELIVLLPEPLYERCLLFSLLCLLGIYVGWYLGRKLLPAHNHENVVSAPLFDENVLFGCGCFCAVFAVSVFFLTYQQWEVTGYIRDLGMLWITAAILLIQVIIYSANKALRKLAIPFLLIALVPPINRFLVYGQRGDTFRMAVIAMLFFFCLKKRPSKLVFLTAAVIFATTMATIQTTRDMVSSGEYPNRVVALYHVVPHFFESKTDELPTDYVNTGSEIVFASAGMEACAQTGRYGFGTGPTTGLIGRFLPKDLFDKASIQTAIQHAGYDIPAITSATGIRIAYGSAPTGFGYSFFELGWFGWVFWILIAMGFRFFWHRAINLDDLRAQGYLAGYFIAVLYALTQDIVTAEVNIVYVLLPLYLIYKYSSRRMHALAN